MIASPLDLYQTACQQVDATAGFYNRNVQVEGPSGVVLVRIPIDGAERMDLRVWPEDQVLASIGLHVRDAPGLLYASSSPRFQIHEYVQGELLHRVAPYGVAVPDHVLADVVRLFGQLVEVPRQVLPPTPEGWPDEGNTAGFAEVLSGVTLDVDARFRADFAELFAVLGIPDRPLDQVVERWPTLTPRPFRLVHADVHRKNMILTAGHVVFLDWELALWGDPLYDLAVHFHKMGYLPEERDRVLRGWLQAVPAECSSGWERDLSCYLAHERAKSAVVDTIRYAYLMAGSSQTAEQERTLVARLTTKLNAAGTVWHWPNRIDEMRVDTALRSWQPLDKTA